MNQAMISALQITIAGMGLVFIAILVLWLVMALLVRWTGSRTEEKHRIMHTRLLRR
jgi:Na+-transporting methylmalonyl-CoA/oxaloacetate decarboxylase gamma subunit